MSVKRLFLFAGYDAHGVIDPSLVYYVKALSALGDVVLCMDSDCSPAELQKLSKYVLHADGTRHGEYDFGSYKRAYIWAYENLNLSDYDFVYMANDSVYGPLYPLQPALEDLESRNMDAFGMVCNPHRNHPHIQSWFIGMRPSVFNTKWFDAFIRRVRKLESKGLITREYEHGFTKAVAEHNLLWGCLLTVRNRGVYNQVRRLYRRGLPFIKKVAFIRHNGRLGRQILYVLNHINPDARRAIIAGATHTWGEEYITSLLTNNPFKIMVRSLTTAIEKIRNKRK